MIKDGICVNGNDGDLKYYTNNLPTFFFIFGGNDF